MSFEVADTQLYKRLCLSIVTSVRRSIHRSVGPLVRPSLSPFVVIKSKGVNTRIYDAAVTIVCVSEQGVGVEWGLY